MQDTAPEPAHLDVIADLQAQIDDLRRQLERVVFVAPTDAAAPEPVASRRSMLKLAGAAAFGTVASVAVAGRAAAEIGYDGTQDVADAVNQRQTASRTGKTAFVFETVGGSGSNGSSFPGALGGWAWDTAAPNGVYGFSGVDLGRGVVGLANGESATGVYGEASQPNGVGVDGRGVTGVSGTSTTGNIGVRGTSTAGTGVLGTGGSAGMVAICPSPIGTGVIGTCFGTAGVGVHGIGGNYGVQGYSEATNGVGGNFAGFAGAVRLGGWQEAAPPSRTIAHERGVIENLPNGDVWYCYEAGTPGKWRKIAGAATAGAFHALAPGRVYDSREALPAPGPLSGGQNRTISVADKRNPQGGAVTTANFVPAGATAVAANVTVVSVAGGGFLACNPGGVTEVAASTINWSAPDQAIANGVILAVNPNRELTVVAGGGTTHFIVDITGYWL